jgi:DNA ligase-1
MKPMRAAKADESKALQFPLYASAKIDGVRAVIQDGIVVSRTLKPIPNAFVQETLGHNALTGLDGELTVGPAFAQNVMQTTTSGVMSREGEPDFVYWVFDFWTAPTMPFGERLQIMQRAKRDGVFEGQTRVQLLPQHLIHNQLELDAFEAVCLEQGYEGVMVRSPMGRYKYGRSTVKEGYLLKVKRFVDSEAVVIGFEEKMHNANQATTNELGYTKRSSHQENLVPAGVLGALICKDLTTGIEFNIGTGFDDVARKQIWDNRPNYLHQLVTYKHFANAGVKVAPRFPVFKAFRSALDL